MAPSVRVVRKKHVKLSPEALLTGPYQVKVGFPAGRVNQDIVNRAVWNHYGTQGRAKGIVDAIGKALRGKTQHIPPRPFLLNAMRKHRGKYLDAMRKSAPKIFRGQTTLLAVLTKLGILAQGDVQQEITDLKTPPNAPSTIRAKGSSNPLIETGEMRAKTTYQVVR